MTEVIAIDDPSQALEVIDDPLAPKTSVKSDENEAQDQTSEDKPPEKPIDYFSGDAVALSLFVDFGFLQQKNNTGGVSIHDLQALNKITKELADKYQMNSGFMNFLVGSISNNEKIYNVFDEESNEFNRIARQEPKEYCKIMSRYMPDNYGFVCRIYLSGNILEDIKSIDSFIALMLKTYISDLTAMQSRLFTLRAINPWQVLLSDIEQNIELAPQSVIIVFRHSSQTSKNIFLIQSVIKIKNWLLRRANRVSNQEVFDDGVSERLSHIDRFINKEQFLGIDDNFLSLSRSRPYRTTPMNSRGFWVKDVENPDHDHDNEDFELLDYDEEAEVSDQSQKLGLSLVDRVKSMPALFSKTKSLILRQKGEVGEIDQDQDQQLAIAEVAPYEISLKNHVGNDKVYQDLQWMVVYADELEDAALRQYRQIFFGCALISPIDLTVDVGNYIKAGWRDIATGFLMRVDYSLKGDSSFNTDNN